MLREPKSRAETVDYLEKRIETALEVARKANLDRTLILILVQALEEARANKHPKPN